MPTQLSLVLAAVIPTGISSFIWVSIYRGNIALTLSIILIDTLLAPFVVPGVLSLLVGTSVSLDIGAMMSSLFWMIVFPSLLGMLLNEWTKGGIVPVWGPRLNPLSKLFMASVVAINGSVVAPYLADFNLKLAGLAVIIVFLASFGYALSYFIAKWLGWNEADQVALVFNGGCVTLALALCLQSLTFHRLLPFLLCLAWYSSRCSLLFRATCLADVLSFCATRIKPQRRDRAIMILENADPMGSAF